MLRRALALSARSMSSFSYARRLDGFNAPTVWHEFTPLANKHGAVNLGQGFPNWECADFAKDAADRAIRADFNQYTRSGGHMNLVNVLAEKYSQWLGRPLDAATEITTSVGATEGMFAAMQALLNEGDEVLLFEPAFDIYPAQVQMAGGVCKYVPLQQPADGSDQWTIDISQVEAAITPRTKVIVLNNPHNPTGKVFTREELLALAAVVERHPDITVVTDEVYEHVVFDGREHVRFATLPNMWDRTLTVSSAGKTFSVTGWKVGWLIGPQRLVNGVMLANQWVQFSVPTPLQEAVAEMLRRADEPYQGHATYYDYVRANYKAKRDALVEALTSAGMHAYVPEGGIFVMANTSAIDFPMTFADEPGPDGTVPVSRDWAFCRWLTVEVGVTAIPPSAFYIPEHKHLAHNLARFAYCKTDESIEEAKKRLAKLAASK